MTAISTRFLVCLLALAILFSGFTGPAAASAPETPTSGPASAPSEFTQPPPGETLSEETQPEETQSEKTLPEETPPEETLPGETLPGETLPEETLPGETLPGETLPEESLPVETLPDIHSFDDPVFVQQEPDPPGPGLYFGLLHAHSSISDHTESVEDVFSSAASTPGLDFFAVTDHSDSFDHHKTGDIETDGSIVSTDWAAGKAAAAAVTNASFVGIYGYEMSWPANMQIGHVSTFCTPGFQSWQQKSYSKYSHALQNYYSTLSSVPGSISQFNHPGTQYGTFLDFAYSEEADRAITLMEIGSGEDGCDLYIRALDSGWHLAPTAGRGNSQSARTVVYAPSLTEEGIYDALRCCRVYATEDSDLEITYTMNGHTMGSRLESRQTGEALNICVTLKDPGDDAAGTVEVITNGGRIAAQQTLFTASGTVNISLPPESGYYFLRITQPDGDTAVTAPIWAEAAEQLGISGVSCETPVPTQNADLLLTLELYNGESRDFIITALEVLADGIPLSVGYDIPCIPAGSRAAYPVTVTAGCVGQTALTIRITGSLDGAVRTFSTALTVSFHQSEQVTAILVDGSHGNADIGRLQLLNRMAAAEQIRLYVAENGLPADVLETCRFLLVSAPSKPFSGEFLKTVSEFASYGGSIILCGQADILDNGISSATELNRLLKAVGSSMRMESSTVENPFPDPADPYLLFPDAINRSSAWCEGISENQIFRLSHGCSVNPGTGTWLVRSRNAAANDPETCAVLACEPLSGGGTVFTAGSLFLTDANMEPPKNNWDEPYANRTLAQTLLGIGGTVLPPTTIADARAAAPGTLVRIRGYATSGTSDPHNTFPDFLYLQDDTGGIAVTYADDVSISPGTPLEIVGFTGKQGANHLLKTSICKSVDASAYHHLPMTGSWDTLLTLSVNSQRLIQVEGTCREIYCREDGTLAGCLLADDQGHSVQIKIEDCITNCSDGKNELHKTVCKNRVIRAAGFLHADEYGDTVIRVRNCEEVTWVPPSRDPSNPPTGDFLPVFLLRAAASLSGLLLLIRKRA